MAETTEPLTRKEKLKLLEIAGNLTADTSGYGTPTMIGIYKELVKLFTEEIKETNEST